MKEEKLYNLDAWSTFLRKIIDLKIYKFASYFLITQKNWFENEPRTLTGVVLDRILYSLIIFIIVNSGSGKVVTKLLMNIKVLALAFAIVLSICKLGAHNFARNICK